MNKDKDSESLSEDEALAILAQYKDQMLKQYDINDLLAPDASDLLEEYSMLAGPKTELGFRRILKDIKGSGGDSEDKGPKQPKRF